MNRRILLLAILGLLTVSCGQFKAMDHSESSVGLNVQTPPPVEGVTPAQIESKAIVVLQSRCTPCHSATLINGGLGAVTNKVHLLAQGFLVPGGAVNSQLFDAINSNRMPIGSSLSDADKATLRTWIIEALPKLPIGAVSFNPTRAILQAKCISCHGAANGNQGGINLESYANARARVVPGGPEQSALFDAVLKSRMPKGGIPLTVKELAIIYGWIYAGANDSGGE